MAHWGQGRVVGMAQSRLDSLGAARVAGTAGGRQSNRMGKVSLRDTASIGQFMLIRIHGEILSVNELRAHNRAWITIHIRTPGVRLKLLGPST